MVYFWLYCIAVLRNGFNDGSIEMLAYLDRFVQAHIMKDHGRREPAKSDKWVLSACTGDISHMRPRRYFRTEQAALDYGRWAVTRHFATYASVSRIVRG
jgi:hypothetical protein